MALVSMREMLADARRRKYAVGAFNITDLATLGAVIDAADELKAPVIVQTSASSTVKVYGPRLCLAMVAAESERTQVPVAIHLDHCTDVALVKRCIDAGFTSVMIDASAQPFEENVRQSREIVEYAAGRDVTVEGELGGIPGVEDDIFLAESQSFLADFDQAVQFCQRTGVHAFAAAVGTAHGLYKGEPKLAFDLFGRIAQAVEPPMVVHGGTGLSVEAFHRFIELGATKINVSTQLKHGVIDSTRQWLEQNPKKYDPIKLLKAQRASLKDTVREFITIFKSADKA
jgi:ketose-bisphosphate aldolase